MKRKLLVTVAKTLQEDNYEPLQITMSEEVEIDCTIEQAEETRMEMFEVLMDNIVSAFKKRGIKYA